MKSPVIIQRLARISSLFITLFLCGFLVLDVGLSMRNANNQTGPLALVLAHLLWPGIALAMTALSWKHHLLGSLLFALAGFGYIVMAWGRFPLSVYLMIAGPFFLTALLHGLAWRAMSGRRV